MELPTAVFGSRRFAQSSDGASIAYYESGNPTGLAITFIHGFGLDHSVWYKAWSHSGLREEFRLIAVDLRGHGASSRPSMPSAYTDGALWADDLEAVFRALSVATTVAVAWSYGGRALNDYLRRFGTARVAGINFVAAATLADPMSIGPHHGLLSDLCSTSCEIERAAGKQFLKLLFGDATNEDDDAHFKCVLGTTSPLVRGWMRNRPLEYEDVLSELRIAVLITHGGQDKFVLPRLATTLASHLSKAQVSLSVYEDAGHTPFIFQSERFCIELIDFARRLRTLNDHR